MTEKPAPQVVLDQRFANVAALPVIVDIAESYALDAAAFVYTFKTVAMPAGATDAEFVSCCLVAKEHGLNPLTKEIYFMRTKSGQIQAIVSVDGWIKKCNEHPAFDGMELRDDRDEKGELTGMFCTIHRKDRKHPTTIREDLKECLVVGGPVWKTSPYRMLRNRVICQCARVAFGFAGLMEPDEFAAWQGMKDITPKAQRAKDIEIPDEEPAPEVVDVPPEPVIDQTPEPAPLNPAEFLRALEQERELCNSEVELEELRAANASVIATLKPRDRKKADAILKSDD